MTRLRIYEQDGEHFLHSCALPAAEPLGNGSCVKEPCGVRTVRKRRRRRRGGGGGAYGLGTVNFFETHCAVYLRAMEGYMGL